MKKNAFTIVELLVVIVVIGVLAAITTVSYTGIAQKATIANMQSDLSNASIQLKMFYIEKSYYPTAINCVNPTLTEICIKKSSNSTIINYLPLPTTNSVAFLFTATNGQNKYQITSGSSIQQIPNIVTDGLVLNMDADNFASYPRGGSSWYDLSGNNHHGTLYNGTVFTHTDSASMSFDGMDDYVALPVNVVTVADIRQYGITYAAWIKTNNSPIQQRIGGQKPSAAYSDLASGGLGIINGKAVMIAYDDGIAYKQAIGTTTLANNNWYYVVGTYSTTDNNMRIYVDGIAEGSPVNILTFNRLLTNGSNTIGKHDSSNPYQFNGQISNFAIYKKALSDTEILQNFNSLRGRYGI